MEENSGWAKTAPAVNGPYWVWHEGSAPFVGFISRRDPDPLAASERKLTSIDGHALRVGDSRYFWHPWQEAAPAPPEIEPEAGTWSSRPWRGGLHRVVDGRFAYTIMITNTAPADCWAWSCYAIEAHGPGLRAATGSYRSCASARWYRYPDPLADVGGVK